MWKSGASGPRNSKRSVWALAPVVVVRGRFFPQPVQHHPVGIKKFPGAHPLRSGAVPLRLPRSSFLLRLQPFDIRHQVRDPLLYLAIMSLADARK